MKQLTVETPSGHSLQNDPWQLLASVGDEQEESGHCEDADLLPDEIRDGEELYEVGESDAEVAEVASRTPEQADRSCDVLSKPRKKRANVDREAQTWFLEYSSYQAKKYGWPMQMSLRMAKELAPEIFQNVCRDAPYKWKRDSQKYEKSGLSAMALTKLAEIARATADVVPVSAPVYKQIFGEQLRAIKIEYDLPLYWVRAFLQSLDLKWGSCCGSMKR